MKKTVIKAALSIFFAFFIVSAPFVYNSDEKIVAVSSKYIPTVSSTIILDPGHGGEDGGAIGVGGIIEKDINLAITFKTADFFRFLGYDIVFTRDSDKMTCDDGLKTQREKKVSDIKNRFELLEETPSLCYISIHQNIFGGDAHGAQVFFSGNSEESQNLAEALQSGISSMLQPENTRAIKESTKDIYILYHTKKPAVLVECGFISNASEAAMLNDDVYQNKMAFTIALSTTKHLTEKEV